MYTIDTMADDVLETLDALGIDGPLVLGGHSMGGYVALSIADRLPTRIRALMLIDTRPGADTPETALVREDLAREVEGTGSVAPVVKAMLPKLFSSTTRERRADLISRVGDVMMKTTPRAVRRHASRAGRPPRPHGRPLPHPGTDARAGWRRRRHHPAGHFPGNGRGDSERDPDRDSPTPATSPPWKTRRR